MSARRTVVTTVVLMCGMTVACTGSDHDADGSTTVLFGATTSTTVRVDASTATAAPAAANTSTTVPVQTHSPLRDLPLPDPVPYTATASVALTDPAFEALPGATAYFGPLGGAVYQLEVPDDWDGTLVMWMHGFGEFGPEARVGGPDFRRYLIAHGIAWAASSFSSTSMIPSLAADETAALWDHVVAAIGRPRWTYVSGFSMGGWATNISAERYGDRYDGAFGLCGAVGVDPGLRTSVDQVVVAAAVAGLVQGDVDASADLGTLLDERVRPALDDPALRARIVDMVVAMTGGPRRFAAEGIGRELDTNWERGRLAVVTGLLPATSEPYELVGVDDAAEVELNRQAIHFPTNADWFAEFAAGIDQTGQLAMPLLTMHTTGDGQVPISQAVAMRELVASAGRGVRLVQRVVEDPGHCGFTTAEQEQGFEALRNWVEHDRRPDGTDLSNPDLTHLDHSFQLAERQSEQQTVTVTGRALLDGQPLDADFIGAVVVDGGLVTPCQAALPAIANGEVSLPVYTAGGAAGCIRDGTQLALWTYVGEQEIVTEAVEVRSTRDLGHIEFAFSTDRPQADVPPTTGFSGELFDAAGARMTTGRVEARIADQLCGVASNRNHGSFDGYIIGVLRTDAAGRCPEDGPITFTVDGRPAEPSIPNTPGRRDALDLTVS